MGLIKRTCRGLKDVSTLSTLYLALVRSQLEFCSEVWSPYQARNITKLERVQRRATQLILKTTDVSNEEKNLTCYPSNKEGFYLIFYSCIKP